MSSCFETSRASEHYYESNKILGLARRGKLGLVVQAGTLSRELGWAYLGYSAALATSNFVD